MAYTRSVLGFFVVFVGLVQLLAIGFCLSGIRLTEFRCLGILAVALALSAWVIRLGRRRGDGPAKTEGAGAGESELPKFLGYTLALALLLVAGVSVISTYIRGDVSYDGNSYHLLSINQWAVTGYIHEVDATFEAAPASNGYPKGAETVGFVWARAFGPRLVGVMNLLYAPLGFFGMALLCQLFGAGPRDSFVLAGCYLLIPANIYQYGSTYVDAAFSSSVIALLGLLAVLLREGTRGIVWTSSVLGCAIGNVIAIKSSGPLVAAACIVTFLVCGRVMRRRVYPDAWPKPVVIAASFIIAIAVGGFWYVKNYICYRNPLYPLAVVIGGHNLFPGLPFTTIFRDQIAPQLQALHPLTRVMVSWLVPLARLKPWYHEVELGSLGEFWILACIPGIILSCYYLGGSGRAFPRETKAIYAFLAASVLLALLATPLAFRSRYTIWLFALGMPSLCVVLTAVRSQPGKVKCFLKHWIMACAAVVMLNALLLSVIQGRTLIVVRAKANPWSIRVAWREMPILPLFPDMESPLLKEILESDRSIAVGPQDSLGHARRISGQIAQPIGRLELVPVCSSVDGADIRRLYSVAGLQHILWLRDRPIPPLLAQNVTWLESDGSFALLKLNPKPPECVSVR